MIALCSSWSPERDAMLTELWAEGVSSALIGERLGISKNAVLGRVHRLHLPPRSIPRKTAKAGKCPNISATAFEAMVAEGMSNSAIGERLGVTKETARRWRNSLGLPPNNDNRGGRRRVVKAPSASPKPKTRPPTARLVAPKFQIMPRGPFSPNPTAKPVRATQKPKERPVMEIDMQALPKSGQCEWPMWGDAEWPTHKYCCAPRMQGSWWLCAEHARLAWTTRPPLIAEAA